MKTMTTPTKLASQLGSGRSTASRPHEPGGAPTASITASTPDSITASSPTETDLPMNTFAPVDELDELDPDIQRPPDDLVDLDDETLTSTSDATDEPTGESVSGKVPAARCADGNGTLVGLFFSDHVVDIARAKAMCGLCPLQEQCLADALEREEPWGVWGGQLLSGGRIIADKRPCGRPPKVPRPDVVYDEMGPVGISLVSA